MSKFTAIDFETADNGRDSACAARREASLTALVSCGLLFITVSSMT